MFQIVRQNFINLHSTNQEFVIVWLDVAVTLVFFFLDCQPYASYGLCCKENSLSPIRG